MTLITPSAGLRTERAVRLPQGQNLATHGQDRPCGADGCTTVLSRYNPNAVCSAHGGWLTPGRKSRR